VLTPADDEHHINKHNFKVPFVCGCRDLGEALRRISEGAAMIRTKVSFAFSTSDPRETRVETQCHNNARIVLHNMMLQHFKIACLASLATIAWFRCLCTMIRNMHS
jgi:hypothetical protein